MLITRTNLLATVADYSDKEQARFWGKMCPEPNTGCWLWTASFRTTGYGQINLRHRNVGAHRLAYELHHGPIPDGLCVLHRCDTPACCNPTHLFLGTRVDNNRDMASKGRSLHGEAHPHVSMTDAEIARLRADHAAGVGPAELTRRTGLTRSRVGTIPYGKWCRRAYR